MSNKYVVSGNSIYSGHCKDYLSLEEICDLLNSYYERIRDLEAQIIVDIYNNMNRNK
jgi:hypothetical protein